jgi:arsenate reductase (thioredoxin)
MIWQNVSEKGRSSKQPRLTRSGSIRKELGLDVRFLRSKNVEEFLGRSFDYIMTVCDRAKETCPVFPGWRNVRDWSFEDAAVASPEARLEILQDSHF